MIAFVMSELIDVISESSHITHSYGECLLSGVFGLCRETLDRGDQGKYELNWIDTENRQTNVLLSV